MDTHNSRQSPRQLLALTLLLCALTLSACLDPACNLTAPSETASSDEQTTNLFVRVNYIFDDRASAINSLGPDNIQVTVKSTAATVARGGRQSLIVNTKKGVRVPVSVNGVFFENCSWNGRTRVLGHDVQINVIPTSISTFFVISCVGW